MTILRSVLALGCLLLSCRGHTWPEGINVISPQGTISGESGYVRNFVPRNATGFKGDEFDSFQKTQNILGARVCMPKEALQTQSQGYPRLQASPGSLVSIRYAENGHVSNLEKGRPQHGGPVWIYGTTNGQPNRLITELKEWNAEGTGGNREGRLLTTHNFDDGFCYEDNQFPVAVERRTQYPLNGKQAVPNYSGLPCQSNFKLPEDVPVNKPYTIFMVWNFTMVDDENLTEIFSNCMDFDIVPASSSAGKAVAHFNDAQPIISRAVPSYFSALAFATAKAGQPGSSASPAASPDASPAASPNVSPAASANVSPAASPNASPPNPTPPSPAPAAPPISQNSDGGLMLPTANLPQPNAPISENANGGLVLPTLPVGNIPNAAPASSPTSVAKPATPSVTPPASPSPTPAPAPSSGAPAAAAGPLQLTLPIANIPPPPSTLIKRVARAQRRY